MSSASYVGCQRDTARICCRAPCVYAYGGSRCYRAPAVAIAQYLLPAEHPAANPPAAVAVDGRERKTDGR